MIKLIQNNVKPKVKWWKENTTFVEEVELLQMETAFPENLTRASQNKKKSSFQILLPLGNSSNAPIDDDIQFQTTRSSHTCDQDLDDTLPAPELQ